MNSVVMMAVVQPAPLRVSQKGTQWWLGALAWRCAGQLTVLPAKAFGKLAVLAERYKRHPVIVTGYLEEEKVNGRQQPFINVNELIPIVTPVFLIDEIHACDGWSQVAVSGITVADSKQIVGGSQIRIAVRIPQGIGRYRETFCTIAIPITMLQDPLPKGTRVFMTGSIVKTGSAEPQVYVGDLKVAQSVVEQEVA